MDITKDIQSIINYSHEFAEQMLISHKEYYPFGAMIENNGELVPVGYKEGESDQPESQKVIDGLRNYFETEFKNKKIRA